MPMGTRGGAERKPAPAELPRAVFPALPGCPWPEPCRWVEQSSHPAETKLLKAALEGNERKAKPRLLIPKGSASSPLPAVISTVKAKVGSCTSRALLRGKSGAVSPRQLLV